MPSDGRRTRPIVIRSLMTALAVLMGIAKPIPALWFDPPVAIMLLMLMTSAREFSKGPPELPGLMAASVWMASSISEPCGVRMGRIELMMPRVMVPLSPNGLPMA